MAVSLRAWVLLATMLAGTAAAADPSEYSARYAVYRNGKLAGKAEFTFEREAERWVVRSEAVGTHGMARVLRARDTELTTGRMRDDLFWPDSYAHHSTVAGIDRVWSASFDWEQLQVSTLKDQRRNQLDLSNGALDGLSLKLEIQRRLRAGETGLVLYLVDDDEIKRQEFRVLPRERLETSLGCLDTVPVERIRTGSTRYTRSWHAPEFGFVTVRLEHGKTDGDHMESRITELVLSGEPVAPQAGCTSRQGGR